MQSIQSIKETDLYQMSIGATGRVIAVKACGAIRQRLLDMGLLPSCEVTKERCALGGDPVWIRLGSVQIALRKSEAQAVLVEMR